MSLSRAMKQVFLVAAMIALAGGASLAAPQHRAQAATSPQFLITWKAVGSNIPSFYQGKALPSYGSRIAASLELVANGKVIDISNETIYWYLNDTLIGGGTGVQQVTFPPFGAPPNTLSLRVEMPNYSGGYLIHTMQIPYANPAAVIYAPYPNGNFSANPVPVAAIPYFFTGSPSQLSYAWSVNGQAGTNAENPDKAEITLPKGTSSGTNINVSLIVHNPAGSVTATAASTLTYENQL